MADWLTELRERRRRRIEDKASGQGTLSREFEAAGRQYYAGLLHTGAAITGSDALREEARRQEEIAALRLSRSELPQSWDEAKGISGIAGYAGHLLIQSAPYIAEFATGAAGGARALARAGLSRGAASTTGGVVAGVPSSTGQVLSAQDEQAGEYELSSALPLGVAHSAVNAVAGPEAMIARGLPRRALNMPARIAVGAAATATGEAGEEVAQTFLEEVGRSRVDPTHDVLGEEAQKRYREAAIGGLLVGGIIGGVAGAPGPRQSRAAAPAGESEEQSVLALPPPDSGPTLYADEFGNVGRRPGLTEQYQRMTAREGQGELFTPGEVFSRPPEAAPQAEPVPDRVALAEPQGEQGDLLAGTSAEMAAELGSMLSRARTELDIKYSQASIIKELREPNKGRMDEFITKLSADLSRLLKQDPEEAIELVNRYAYNVNSPRRNAVLNKAAEIITRYQQDTRNLQEEAVAARQMIEQQYAREMAEQARRRQPRPGAHVQLPEPGDASEQQIRERNRQQAIEEGVKDIEGTVEQSIKRPSTVERRRILRRVLDDPETQNPMRRFIAELRKAGFRRGVTEEEARIIRRFEEVRDAFAGLEPDTEASGSNELTPEVTAIRERQPEEAQPQQEKQRPPRSRYAPENFQLEPPPSTPEAFERIERAAARRARRREKNQTTDSSIRDARQLELFTPTGRPTRAAQGLPPQPRRQRGLQALTTASAEVQPLATETSPESASEPTPQPTPEPTVQPTTQVDLNRWTNMIERAVDREQIGMLEAMELYQLLDEGRVDEVKKALRDAALAQREASGQTGAAKTPTREAARRAEAEAREIERRDRTVRRQDEEDDVWFSDAEDRFRPVENPTTTQELSKLRELFGSPQRFDKLVKIHATQEDAIRSGAATEEDFLGRRVRGFVKDGEVHLIAENIEKGTELAVFLHEIGGHIGLKDLVGPRNFAWIREQVESWANRTDGSVEARVGQWVMQRTQGMSPSIRHEEIVAYAIEGLVQQGVTPQSTGAAGNMFRRIWAAVKAALRKLGFKNPSMFTGQHLVDLAFGAADLQLRGTWHGTAANPRVFNDRYIGTGEGNALYGWGHYLTDLFEIGEVYRKADSERKFRRQDRGNLLRTITTVGEDELLLWDEPLNKQPVPVRDKLKKMPQLRLLLERDANPTGEDIYTFLAHMIATGPIKLPGYETGEESEKAASQLLDRAGIKGIKYLNRFSRFSRIRGEGTYNYVIFNARNIVRAHSRPGGDRTRIRFSEVGPGPETIRHPAQELGVRYATTLQDLLKKGLYNVAFGRDLRDLFRRVLPSYKGYFDTMAEKQATMLELFSKVNKILVDAQAVKGEERAKLNRFLMDSTRQQKWGFKPDWVKDAVVDPAMARQFNALSKEAQEIAKRIFRHGHETLMLKNKVVQDAFNDALKEVDQELMDPTTKRKTKERIMRQLNLYNATFYGLKGPYAPLARFGNHVVTAKSQRYVELENRAEQGDKEAKDALNDLRQDPDHYAVFFRESAGEAEVLKRELDATGKFARTERFEKEAYYKGIQDAPWMALLRLKNLLAEHAETAQGREQNIRYLNGLLRDLYLSSLAEASARKHDLRRENIEGADPNMLRAFAHKGKADAHFIAALQHNGKVIEQLSKMRNEAGEDTKPGGPSKADRKRALNVVLRRHAQSLEPNDSPLGWLSDRAMSLTSFWMLATSPRYYIQNLLQVPMISVPTMAGHYGLAKSWAAVQKAYRDLLPGFESFREALRGNYDIDALNISQDEKDMLKRLRDTGLLDVGMQYDLGYWEATDEGGWSATLAKVNHKVRTIARQIEVVNRVSTALATYRLERERGGSYDDALQAADDIVSQTHGDYSYLNRSVAFRALPKIITQFRTYQMIQLSLIARYAAMAFQGASPEERALGRRVLGYVLSQHAIVTGALGLPAVQGIAYVMALAFGDDDEPADSERFLRRLIGDDDVANFILRGVPAGMGLDVSKYIGMGEATSIAPYTEWSLKDREAYAMAVIGMMGPAISGVGANMWDGMSLIQRGDFYKGIEMMMPSGIKAGMRALRLATEGQTNRRGDQLLTPEELSAFDIAAQALGFETTKLQELRRKRSDLYAYEEYFRDRSADLKRRYTRAFRDGDQAEMARLREDWLRLQNARRRVGFKVQPLSQLVRAPAEQKRREARTIGGVQFNTGNRGFVERLTQ